MYNKVEDYLKDDAFIMYVLGDESAFKAEFINENIKSKQAFEEAKSILLASGAVIVSFYLSHSQQLKHLIFATLFLHITFSSFRFF